MEQNLKKPSFLKSALSWAAFMYVFNVGFTFLLQDELTWKMVILGIPFWMAAGIGWAYINSHFTGKSNKKVNAKRQQPKVSQ